MQIKSLEKVKVSKSIPDAFLGMYKNTALSEASSFLSHEHEIVSNIISKEDKIENIIVVGSGPAAYLDLAQGMDLTYIGIDPYFEVAENRQVYHLNCSFEEIERAKLPEGNCLFLFWFNILNYLDVSVCKLKKVFRQGDIVIHSTWDKTDLALSQMQRYFKVVYQDSVQCYKKAIRNIHKKNEELLPSHIFPDSKKIIEYSNEVNYCSVIYY